MIGTEVGPYRILEKIGQGGMGIVYKGIHVQLEQDVVIKVLSPYYAADPSMRERFIQEAKVQAQLTHPHVVNILNYLESGEDIFLVMEYVKGETLEKRLTTSGKLPQHEAVSICHNILSALEFMHSKGVIHRDIKPGNIMFTDTGLVKVTDFGLVKVVGEDGHTKTGMRLGTLWYMSPEQIQGQAASVASDIYALGITLYQMVTGKLPFAGDSEYTLMRAHVEEVPKPPWVINAHISQDLGRVILKALAKQPGQRYQNTRDFAEALAGLPLQQAHESQGDPPVAVPYTPTTRHAPRLSIRHSVTVLTGCSALLVILLYFGFFSKGAPGPMPSARPHPAPVTTSQEPPMHIIPWSSAPSPAGSQGHTSTEGVTTVVTIPPTAFPQPISHAGQEAQPSPSQDTGQATPSVAAPAVLSVAGESVLPSVTLTPRAEPEMEVHPLDESVRRGGEETARESVTPPTPVAALALPPRQGRGETQDVASDGQLRGMPSSPQRSLSHGEPNMPVQEETKRAAISQDAPQGEGSPPPSKVKNPQKARQRSSAGRGNTGPQGWRIKE